MKKRITRLMALTLALCVLLSGPIPMAVTAVETDGESTDTTVSSQPSAAPEAPSEPSTDTQPEPQLPTLEHTPITFVPGVTLNFSVTTSEPSDYVTVCFRSIGVSAYSTEPMYPDEGGSYICGLEANQITGNGIEYYIEAHFGDTVVTYGSAEEPIRVQAAISIDGFRPAQTNSAVSGIDGSLNGQNFVEGMELKIGDTVVDYTLKSSTRITFALPFQNMGKYDITLSYNGQTVTLPQAITYTDSTSFVLLNCSSIPYGGDQVRIPVVVSATGKIFAADIAVRLDPTHFTNIGFEPGSGNADAMYAATTAEDGTLRISMTAAAGQSLMTGEPIGYITATAASLSQQTESKVEVLSAMFNAVAVGVTAGCTVTVQPTYSVTGKVTYFGTGTGIAGVTVTLSDGQTAVTDENGVYLFEGLKVNDLTVSVSYAGHANHAITSQDAALILKEATAQNTFNSYQITAGDMDGDGHITALDAYIVLNKVVGNNGAFPSVGADWVFVNPTESSYDFVGILRGDVSGSWSQDPAEELE